MNTRFIVAVCLFGALVDFVVWAWLRSFKVRDRPPASLAGLSVEQRQQRITIASWGFFGMGWFFVAGAALLYLRSAR